MSKSNKRPPIVFIIGILLVCLTLASMCMNPGLYARYASSADASATARVAKFEIDTDLQSQASTLDLTDIKPGFSQVITLKVQNKSEVSVTYRFSVKSMENLPLEFEFSDNGAGQLTLDGAQEATHTLTVFWPEDEDHASYASEIDLVTVVLTCTQID